MYFIKTALFVITFWLSEHPCSQQVITFSQNVITYLQKGGTKYKQVHPCLY